MYRGDRESQTENQITKRIIGFAIAAHRALGPGLVESAHEEYLSYELTRQGIPFPRQLPLPIRYQGLMLDCGYRMDSLAGGLVIAQAAEDLSAIYEAQLLAYLRLGGKPVGLLGDFNIRVRRQGLKRIANQFPDSPGSPPSLP